MLGLQLDPSISRTSWREAIAFPGLISLAVMATAFFPGLADAFFGIRPEQEFRTSTILFIYSWIALTMLIAWFARNIESTRFGRFLAPVLVYVVGYGPVLCAVTVDAYFKERRHADARWEKTEKIGRVAG